MHESVHFLDEKYFLLSGANLINRFNTFVAYLGPDVDFVLGVVPGGARHEEGVRPNLHGADNNKIQT